MYGMNFLFGNNFGFGGFGCCCRPMANPFMLGAMQGYNSQMFAYAMCGGGFDMPPLFSFGQYSQNQYNPSMPFTGSYDQFAVNRYDNNFSGGSYASFESSNSDFNTRYEAVSKRWKEAFNKQFMTESAKAETTEQSSVASSTATNVSKVNASKDFKTRVDEIAKELVCKPEDLLALMNSESGLKANAENKSGQGAVGLIQFTTPAIKELNRHGIKITKEELLKMSAVEQLDYVEKYLKIAKSYKFSADHPLKAGDLYAINYLPGRASVEHLASRGDKYYEANKGLDIDGDGIISKSDLAKRLDKFRVSLVA